MPKDTFLFVIQAGTNTPMIRREVSKTMHACSTTTSFFNIDCWCPRQARDPLWGQGLNENSLLGQ